ncbi:MAG: hypothetical protein DRJ64_04355 [Thermoprotei archaeon]|nr:MAG: hypothetical protein DRJ64_04355 [Thermoprotei archaeon]
MLSTIEKALSLKNVELFHEISGEVLAHIATLLEEEFYEKGTYVVNQGDLGRELYIIVTGEVDVVAGGKKVDVMSDGAYFGEMAIIDSQPRSADVIATTNLVVLKMAMEDFHEILTQQEHVAIGVIRVLNRRIRNLNQRLQEFTNQ